MFKRKNKKQYNDYDSVPVETSQEQKAIWDLQDQIEGLTTLLVQAGILEEIKGYDSVKIRWSTYQVKNKVAPRPEKPF